MKGADTIMRPVRAAVIGAGSISDIYLKNMTEKFDILDIAAICARTMEHAEVKARQYGIRAQTLEEILADPDIEMVINLTPAPEHYAIIRAALLAGKHAYTEKSITMETKEAEELLQLASEKGLYLGAAPDTFLGSAFQTARKLIDEGAIGETGSFVMSANRCNDWLLSRFAPLNLPGGDIGHDYLVYYLTVLVSLLGPVVEAAGQTRTPYPTHRRSIPGSPDYGTVFETPNISEISSLLRLESGVIGTLSVNADSVMADMAFSYIYGTKGILCLPDPNQFGGNVRILRSKGGSFETEELVPSLSFGFDENSRGIGPADMAYAIRTGRKCRASGELALHVLEVVDRIIESGGSGRFLPVRSRCERPAPMGMLCEDMDQIFLCV